MNESGTTTLVVTLTILAVVVFNLLLFAVVKYGSRNRNTSTFGKVLNTAKNPFKESDSQIDELSDLVKMINNEKEVEEDENHLPAAQ